MKYLIVSTGLFITAAILYSTAYISSAIVHLITNRVGENILTSQTQPLFIWSILTVILAIIFLLVGLFKKDSPSEFPKK